MFALIDENSSSGANQTNSAVPSTPTTPAPLPRDDLSSKLGKDTLSEGDEDIVFHGITFTGFDSYQDQYYYFFVSFTFVELIIHVFNTM